MKRVKLGIKRSQRELSDLWCRLMMPLNTTGLLGMKAVGFDILVKHRGDFPFGYFSWIDRCMDMMAVEFFNDQGMHTEIYDAVQGAFAEYDIIVTPTLACPSRTLPTARRSGRSESTAKRWTG